MALIVPNGYEKFEFSIILCSTVYRECLYIWHPVVKQRIVQLKIIYWGRDGSF